MDSVGTADRKCELLAVNTCSLIYFLLGRHGSASLCRVERQARVHDRAPGALAPPSALKF